MTYLRKPLSSDVSQIIVANEVLGFHVSISSHGMEKGDCNKHCDQVCSGAISISKVQGLPKFVFNHNYLEPQLYLRQSDQLG